MPDASPLPTGPLLIVSPDLGDAALSCAALLERVDPLTVLDVFTLVPEPDRSDEWDRECGFLSAREAMAAREKEEAVAFEGSFHEVLAVDLLSHRYRDERPNPRDARRLGDALEGWVARSGRCTVAVPAGAGVLPGMRPGLGTRVRGRVRRHALLPVDPDHLWVRDTVTRLLVGHDDVMLWLYEEWPHAMSHPADGAVQLFAEWSGQHPELVAVTVDRAVKAGRVAAYESSTSALLGARSAAGIARTLPARERYWAMKSPPSPQPEPA